ncbi:Carbon monoxide dehydrogenase medium chain [Sinorhizobium sojae CCBAU 05684]|uniref:Carbon monoxide dehydrogenase medium chain n=1 Tax=Sinorhizobium sojae CCBAU 05684 TaxID=716928 RepID=A0A249PEZ3_9HYPH|nr:xanthine dehydrogenase family protein subunit M [Sinorhizobium sojae]ASY64501.1 Carbon monoxide dehydrogenase medium chain [Sinorhizobium sojae CCBAU 05684]
MYETNYHRASSIGEALKLMGSSAEGKYLSGGMTLIPTMKQRLAAPSDLIDLRHIAEMKGIAVDGRTVTIGAASTHEEVATCDRVKAVCPALCVLASHIGDPHVRHMGTIGGSVANNDPAADYPAAILALDATVVTDRREIKAGDFFTGLFETALDGGEIIIALRFEAPEKASYQKFANPASRYAMAGVFVARRDNGDVRVAVTGAGSDGVFRHAGIESALAGNWSPDAVTSVAVNPSDLLSDLHATAPYRANLIKVMARRAVAAA